MRAGKKQPKAAPEVKPRKPRAKSASRSAIDALVEEGLKKRLAADATDTAV